MNSSEFFEFILGSSCIHCRSVCSKFRFSIVKDLRAPRCIYLLKRSKPAVKTFGKRSADATKTKEKRSKNDSGHRALERASPTYVMPVLPRVRGNSCLSAIWIYCVCVVLILLRHVGTGARGTASVVLILLRHLGAASVVLIPLRHLGAAGLTSDASARLRNRADGVRARTTLPCRSTGRPTSARPPPAPRRRGSTSPHAVS